MVSQGGKKTKQREALRSVIGEADRPLSVAELLAAGSSRVDGLGQATVYRTISALVNDGLLTAVEIPGEPIRYERSDKEHHHHFYCEKCLRVFDISGCMENLNGLLHDLVPAKFKINSILKITVTIPTKAKTGTLTVTSPNGTATSKVITIG